MFYYTLLYTVALTAFTPTPSPPLDSSLQAQVFFSDTIMQGVVKIVGSDPGSYVVLDPTDSEGVVPLTGYYARELRQLQGAVVRVKLMKAEKDSYPPRAMRVVSYRLQSINGKTAIAGILRVERDSCWLQNSKMYKLFNSARELKKLKGMKIWVSGDPVPGGFRVDSFGLIVKDPRLGNSAADLLLSLPPRSGR